MKANPYTSKPAKPPRPVKPVAKMKPVQAISTTVRERTTPAKKK